MITNSRLPSAWLGYSCVGGVWCEVRSALAVSAGVCLDCRPSLPCSPRQSQATVCWWVGCVYMHCVCVCVLIFLAACTDLSVGSHAHHTAVLAIWMHPGFGETHLGGLWVSTPPAVLMLTCSWVSRCTGAPVVMQCSATLQSLGIPTTDQTPLSLCLTIE
jgi:hypothetical protein